MLFPVPRAKRPVGAHRAMISLTRSRTCSSLPRVKRSMSTPPSTAICTRTCPPAMTTLPLPPPSSAAATGGLGLGAGAPSPSGVGNAGGVGAFAGGGVVPGSPGQARSIVAHGGEEIANPNIGQAVVVDGQTFAVREAGRLAAAINAQTERNFQQFTNELVENLS